MKKNIQIKNTEKKCYIISRFVIFFIALILFQIMFINEDVSFKYIGFILSLITFALSFICTNFSKKILYFGEKLQGIKKILYYIFFPFAITVLLIIYIIIGIFIIYPVIDKIQGWDGLGIVLLFWLTVIISGIMTFLPYLQTLIVLAIRKIKPE